MLTPCPGRGLILLLLTHPLSQTLLTAALGSGAKGLQDPCRDPCASHWPCRVPQSPSSQDEGIWGSQKYKTNLKTHEQADGTNPRRRWALGFSVDWSPDQWDVWGGGPGGAEATCSTHVLGKVCASATPLPLSQVRGEKNL